MGEAIHSTSVDQTVALGEALGKLARAGDLIGLVGELGAGKTQFVRGLARGMGLDESAVSSPTFVMIQEYGAETDGVALVHIDAYRLSSVDDLESIGWDASSLLAGGEMRQSAVVVIEWADRLKDLLGEDYLLVAFAHEDEHTRLISATCRGSWRDRSASGGLPGGAVSPRQSMCPICGAAVQEHAPSYPFCSDRCKTIDLGRWIDGRYFVSRPLEQADLEEE